MKKFTIKINERIDTGKRYLLIYYKSENNMVSEYLTVEKIKEKVENMNYDQYMIVDGIVVKSFNNKNLNL